MVRWLVGLLEVGWFVVAAVVVGVYDAPGAGGGCGGGGGGGGGRVHVVALIAKASVAGFQKTCKPVETKIPVERNRIAL